MDIIHFEILFQTKLITRINDQMKLISNQMTKINKGIVDICSKTIPYCMPRM